MPNRHDDEVGFRVLTHFEKTVILNILDSDSPREQKLLTQVPSLLGSPDPESGSLWLSSPDENDVVAIRNTKGGAIRKEGQYRSAQNRPITFIVFVDDHERLSELLVVKFDFEDYPKTYELDRIVYDTEAR